MVDEPRKSAAPIPPDPFLVDGYPPSPVKLRAACEALKKRICGADSQAREAAHASAAEIIDRLWESMRRLRWALPDKPDAQNVRFVNPLRDREGTILALNGAIETVLALYDQKVTRFLERDKGLTLEEMAADLGCDPSEIKEVAHPEAEMLSRWEAIKIVDGKFPPRWTEFGQMCEGWHIPMGSHNDVLSDIEIVWADLLEEGADERALLAYLFKKHGIAISVAKKMPLADLAKLLVEDFRNKPTYATPAPETPPAPTPPAASQATPSVENKTSPADSTDWISVVAAVADDNAIAIIRIASDITKTTDQKMQDIYAIDNRAVGWDSPKWASILIGPNGKNVSAAMIRKTDWWKKERPRLRE